MEWKEAPRGGTGSSWADINWGNVASDPAWYLRRENQHYFKQGSSVFCLLFFSRWQYMEDLVGGGTGADQKRQRTNSLVAQDHIPRPGEQQLGQTSSQNPFAVVTQPLQRRCRLKQCRLSPHHPVRNVPSPEGTLGIAWHCKI